MFDACQTDRNRGLTSCVGSRQRSLHGLCPERGAGRQTPNASPLTADEHTVSVCLCVWEGLREVKDTHTHTNTCEMRDLTSPSGSDIGGHTVPHTVYAGKTLYSL